MLGLMLNLPLREVEAIFAMYSDPRDRLLHIIIAFLRQAEADSEPAVNDTAAAAMITTEQHSTQLPPTGKALSTLPFLFVDIYHSFRK